MPRRPSTGFTLIEMVISLTLLSFIAIIGYQGLSFGIQQWHKGHDKMRFQYDHHQALGWMRNKLGAAEKVRKPIPGSRAYQFTGAADSVEFVARYERSRRAGLYVNKIELDRQKQRLYVSYYLFHPDIDGEAVAGAIRRVTLLDDVASFRLEYYGRKDKTGARWHDDWSNAALLPRLLRVEIETVDGVNHNSVIAVLTSDNAN